MLTGAGVYQHLSRLNRKKKLSMNQNKEDGVVEVITQRFLCKSFDNWTKKRIERRMKQWKKRSRLAEH